MLAGSEARLEHARCSVDLGAALRRANQRTEARERLREGVDLAQRSGLQARRAGERRDRRHRCQATKGPPDRA